MLQQIHRILFVALVCGLVSPVCRAQDAEKEMATLAEQLAKPLIEKQRARVTALDFHDIQGRPNELGRYLAEQFAVELVAIKGITVLDRTNIASIMAEHQLTADGLVKPENAKKLGQFAGVDAIVIGTLASMDKRVVLTVRAISTETAEVVAAGRANIQGTPEIQRMLGLSIEPGSRGHNAVFADDKSATASNGESLALREVGPISMVLRNVVRHSVQVPEDKYSRTHKAVSAIRCTFDAQNRSLQKHVAIAVNQTIEPKWDSHTLSIAGFRGSLADSNHQSWKLLMVNGAPAVVCFENQSASLAQGNPGGIVEYIRSGKRYAGENLEGDFGGKDKNLLGRYWAGSFGAIRPGETSRITVDFVPVSIDGEGRSGRSKEAKAVDFPESFQFDMELVLATYSEGEDPLRSTDMVLRNLTIDRVVLPRSVGPEK